MAVIEELARERAYLSWLYELVDADRQYLLGLQREALSREADPGQERLDRDAMVGNAASHLARLDAVGASLCFGKLVETATRQQFYIGRLAVADEVGGAALVDWRAPIAAPFYRATAVDPMGMALRRHLITVGRRLDGIEDELLDGSALENVDAASLVGEAALLHALNRERTGRMSDIVATIQRDQDTIIRAPLKSTLLVTGGPGTGKTVVALHRAAYLLYAHQAVVSANGMLVVGPSDLFVRYIERVLPSLGETSVVLTSWSRLLPGMDVNDEVDPAIGELKGRIVMAEVMRRTVALFERAPRTGIVVLDVNGNEQRLPHAVIDSIRRRVRALGHPHNESRRQYRRALAAAARVNQVDDDNQHAEKIKASLDRAVDRLWPRLSPTQVLHALFTSPRLLKIACNGLLHTDELSLLMRAEGRQFTTSDLPLLDELRVLLGTAPDRVAKESEAEVTIREMARDAIEEIASAMDAALEGTASAIDEGGTTIRDLLTPEMLVERHHGPAPQHSLPEMAQRDPSWRYSHVVVDEAQDATPMQWRAVWRRTTGGSMTIVGDPDQASRPTNDTIVDRIIAGAPKAVIDHRMLDVNYRTPAEIVEPARHLRELRTGMSDQTTTRYVRDGVAPWISYVASIDATSVRSAVKKARGELGAVGRLAVVAPRRYLEMVRNEVAALTDSEVGRGASRLDTQVAVYLPTEVKGLEFDSVLVIDPALIESDHGWRHLYVTLTRPTRHLGQLVVGLRDASMSD